MRSERENENVWFEAYWCFRRRRHLKFSTGSYHEIVNILTYIQIYSQIMNIQEPNNFRLSLRGHSCAHETFFRKEYSLRGRHRLAACKYDWSRIFEPYCILETVDVYRYEFNTDYSTDNPITSSCKSINRS